jgi:hypothetical protein
VIAAAAFNVAQHPRLVSTLFSQLPQELLLRNVFTLSTLCRTQGINKAVILGMVDTMLANKEVSGTLCIQSCCCCCCCCCEQAQPASTCTSAAAPAVTQHGPDT